MDPTDLLDKNRLLFNEMKKLAIKQEKCVSEDQIFEYLNFSNRRERLEREISKNNKRYGSLVKERSTGGSKKSDDNLNREIKDVIRSIQEVDRRVEKFILEKRDNLLHDAQKLRRGKKAVKGYGGKSLNMPRFLNRKG